jgi:hypothetical protein
MLSGYDDGAGGSDEAIWSGDAGPEDDAERGDDLAFVSAAPPAAPAPRKGDKGGNGGQVAKRAPGGGLVDLEKLLKGPIDEVYRTNSPGDAEFLVAHMKQSLAGLKPTIESFERFNSKLEEENRRLAEEEADLDERLRALGIVVEPGPGQLAAMGDGEGDEGNDEDEEDNADELLGFEQVREGSTPTRIKNVTTQHTNETNQVARIGGGTRRGAHDAVVCTGTAQAMTGENSVQHCSNS